MTRASCTAKTIRFYDTDPQGASRFGARSVIENAAPSLLESSASLMTASVVFRGNAVYEKGCRKG